MRHVSGLYALVTSLVLFTSTNAFAQQGPSPADRETARSLMDEGDKKRDSGDLKGALKSYEAADAIMHVPTTGIEVARTQIALGQLLEARETLGRVLRIPAKPGEPAPFVAARKTAETLNAELAPRIPAIQVSLENAEPDAAPQITIDNEPIPPAAAFAPRKVNPGPHVVVVKLGSFEKSIDVTVAERETKTVTVDVKERSAEPPGPPQDQAKSSSASPLPKILMFGGIGLAAVGIGVGSVTGLMSISKTNDLKAQCPNDQCPASKQGEIDDAKGIGNISTAAFIVGGIGIGAGVVGFILSNKAQKEPASSESQARVVRPVIGPSYLGMTGTF